MKQNNKVTYAAFGKKKKVINFSDKIVYICTRASLAYDLRCLNDLWNTLWLISDDLLTLYYLPIYCRKGLTKKKEKFCPFLLAFS